jgi:peroxiredoxin
VKNIPLISWLALGLVLFSSGVSSAGARLQPGDPAAEFTVIGPDGEEVRLSDFRGKVVVLDFWATWCVPCLKAMPELSQLAESRAQDGLVVLSICVADTRENYDTWVSQNAGKYAFRTAHDPVGKPLRESLFSSVYGVSMLPAIFVVDRDGGLVGRAITYPKEKANIGELLLEAGLTETAREAPKPAFRETLGKLKAGDPLPPVRVEARAGESVALSDLAGDGPLVLTVFSGNRLNSTDIEFLNGWSERYAGQGLRMVGLAAYGPRQAFDEWMAEVGDSLKFPVVFDPAGASPATPKPREEMTDEEMSAYNALRRAHFAKVVPMVLSGGSMAPVPHTLVADREHRFLGMYIGTGPDSVESLANLLLRAGIPLEEGDRPAHVFTPEETAPAPTGERVPQRQPGQPAPDFPAFDIDGNEVNISTYRGKVVVLDFWATWCGPCMIAFPHMQKVAETYKDQGVVIIGSGTRDTRSAFEKWIRANAARYPDIIWSHDPAERGPERASHALYGVTGIPTQFIIGRDGIIKEVVVGYLEGEVLLEAALAKAGIKVPEEVLLKAEENKRQRRRLQ